MGEYDRPDSLGVSLVRRVDLAHVLGVSPYLLTHLVLKWK